MLPSVALPSGHGRSSCALKIVSPGSSSPVPYRSPAIIATYILMSCFSDCVPMPDPSDYHSHIPSHFPASAPSSSGSRSLIQQQSSQQGYGKPGFSNKSLSSTLPPFALSQRLIGLPLGYDSSGNVVLRQGNCTCWNAMSPYLDHTCLLIIIMGIVSCSMIM